MVCPSYIIVNILYKIDKNIIIIIKYLSTKYLSREIAL